MELLKGEGGEFLDAKENFKRDGKLCEGHQEHGEHAHAGLLVYVALLERDALYVDLFACLYTRSSSS